MDVNRFGAFYNGLGDFLDHYRGIAFLLFAESGYWNAAMGGGLQDSYAAQRINQGIANVPDHGPLTTVSLPQPSADVIRSLVEARLDPLHGDLRAAVPECADMIDELFPLSPVVLEPDSDSDTASIRLRLLNVRDAYRAALQVTPAPPVIGPPAPPTPIVPPSPPSPPPPAPQPAQVWDNIYVEMDREVDANMSGLANELQAALTDWIRLLAPCCMPWTAGQVETKSVGSTPYEQFTLCTWHNGPSTHQCAIGFLLGFGAGIPNDLKKKFAALERIGPPVASALILYPTAKYPNLALPSTAQKVWDQVGKKAVHLRAIPREAVVTWLTVAKWRDQNGGGSDAPAIDFIRDKTRDLFHFIAPAP